MAKKEPAKKTAETVSTTRKLDHLMMLVSAMLTKAGTKPKMTELIKEAAEKRDQIYQYIDLQKKIEGTKSNTGKKAGVSSARKNLIHRVTFKPLDQKPTQ